MCAPKGGGRLKLRVACVAALVLLGAEAGAQAGTVTGVVVDSAGLPVFGAELTVFGTSLVATTGERGEFRMPGLRPGPVTLRVRRLGFRPDSLVTEVTDRGVSGITIRLSRVAAQLSPVTVRSSRVDFTGRLAGYYERLERKTAGYFITRAQIDAENPRTLTQLLAHAPGLTAVRGRAGQQGVRMRGRRCWPLVWLDGTPMPSGDVDLDGIPPNTIHGIELYLGSTTAPFRYSSNRDLSSCGTILLWSRGPDTDPIRRRGQRRNIDVMLASLAVYTADKVDSPVSGAPGRPLEVAYPAALLAERLAGTTVAEFVVGTDGSVEMDTFGVVSSTHPLFTEAVRQALQGATFIPAVKAGRAVRQVVHLPFRFAPPG
jgi:TonB family protein